MENVGNLENTFKKPTLIGRVGKLPRKLKESAVTTKQIENVEEDITIGQEDDDNKEVPSLVNEGANNDIDFSSNLLTKPNNTSGEIANKYQEPKWSRPPDPEEGKYSFEVIKSGVILETIQLNSRAYWIFGRLPDCDVIMAHPTISRYHAVLQFRPSDDDKKAKGWYIYDLGSTHGTFLNKNKVPVKSYVRVKTGFILKLGASTRNYILQSDIDDHESNEMTVTEMIQKKQELREAIMKRDEDLKNEQEKRDNQGIDWGMGEDADEESDLTENPFAMTNNEELFLDDPKKTLRGFFEREGLELVYNVEEKGTAHFVCRIELPVDDANGRQITAEYSHHGKKKEVVVQCALEACRILDRFGMLRQSSHEPRKRKPASSDSDDDDFWDRTGDVERKRLKKLQQLNQKPCTHAELLKQEQELLSKISSLEAKLLLFKKNAVTSSKNNDIDELDYFMSELKEEKIDNITRRKIMVEVKQLKDEHAQLQKLIKIAEPNKLPELQKINSAVNEPSKGKNETKQSFYPLFGKRITSKKANISSNKTSKDLVTNIIKQSQKPENKESNIELEKIQQEDSESQNNKNNMELINDRLNEFDDNTNKSMETEKQNQSPKIKHVSPDICEDLKPECSSSSYSINSSKSNKVRRNRFRDRTKDERSTDDSENIEELGEKYNTWVPPVGQTGDGKTKLNEKFGY